MRPAMIVRALQRAVLPVAVGVCAVTAGPASAAGAETDFKRFFTGRTEGVGRLKVIMRSAVDVRVRGTGHVERDGTLVLEQVVNEGAKPARTRTWRIREVSPGRYAGTLSDARGPVTAERVGGRLHIAFTGADGNGYQQWLTFTPDGRAAHNTLQVRKFGMTAATLEETIRKLD